MAVPAAASVVVLGAGPAGLGAAYRLARAGHDVVVLEAADRVGGAAGSVEVAGMRVDLGSHRLHPSTDPRILAELRRLLGGDLQQRVRNGRIRLGGRWIAFPLRPSDLVAHLPPGFAAAAARDALTAPLRRPAADTFAEVVRARLGPTLAERFYLPYAAKLWGADPQHLSGEQARRRVRADTAGKLLRRVAGGRRPHTFLYPRGGFGQLWEALADAAVAHGAALRTGARVERVTLAGGVVEVAAGDGTVVRASQAWSTLPLPLLARLVEPAPPRTVLAAAGRLRFRAMVLVYLVLATDRYTPFDAHYLPGPETPVTRVSEPKNYRSSAADPPGRTVLCAEVPCEVGDPLWAASDDELGEVARDALRGCGLTDPRPEAVEVIRLPRAYPIYDVGYDDAFEVLDRWVRGEPRLLSFGRQGLFVHDNSHHALAMAWAAADALRADGSLDPARWAQARAAFADHVVED